MYEVVLYAAIATVVCVMLYSVLGKSVGRGPEQGIDPSKLFEAAKEDVAPMIEPVVTDPDIPALADIAKADASFAPAYFMDGAKGAYSMILEAFAEGDVDTLKALLTPSVFDVYEAAINDRNEKNLTQVTDLARLIDADIVDASKTGSIARISVRYSSELASALLDADGNTVEGDTDILAQVREVWTFERDLKSGDPNWLLGDVAPADNGDPQADPTPNTSDKPET